MDKTVIVISHYAERDSVDLESLLAELKRFNINVFVVVNDDRVFEDSLFTALGANFLIRPNKGMNIGGWSAAIKYCADFDHVIFLQDECKIISNDFIECYSEKLRNSSIGMVGESLNYKWALDWEKLSKSSLNYRINFSNQQSVNRVTYYLNCLKDWGVNPGATGLHLRALIWGFSSKVLTSAIKSFPEGNNKEQCIASEIAVTKLIEQMGLIACQSNPQPFKYVAHKEWASDGSGKFKG